MTQKLFEGVMVPLFLPLDGDEKIVQSDLERYVRHHLDCGVHAFLVPSGTGEFYALTFEQRRRAVEIVAKVVSGTVPVVSITSACGLRDTLSLSEAARDAGVDAIMVTPPYYWPVDQQTLKRFFCAIAAAEILPLWLYHHPPTTKLSIEPETVAELAEQRNIVGIKASADVDILYFHKLVRALRDRPEFRLLMGEDINELSGLILGGHGMVSTVANIMPNEFVALWQAIKSADYEQARKLQDRIMDVYSPLLFRYPNWQGTGKLILKKQGLFSSIICAEPCPVLTDVQQREIESNGSRLRLF